MLKIIKSSTDIKYFQIIHNNASCHGDINCFVSMSEPSIRSPQQRLTRPLGDILTHFDTSTPRALSKDTSTVKIGPIVLRAQKKKTNQSIPIYTRIHENNLQILYIL